MQISTPRWIVARRDAVHDGEWKITGLWFQERCPGLVETSVIDDLPVGEIPDYDIAVFRNHHGADYANPENFEKRTRRLASCGPRPLMPGAALRGFINAFDSGWF